MEEVSHEVRLKFKYISPGQVRGSDRGNNESKGVRGRCDWPGLCDSIRGLLTDASHPKS